MKAMNAAKAVPLLKAARMVAKNAAMKVAKNAASGRPRASAR